MLKKIFLFLSIFALMISPLFSYESYRNAALISTYKTYIENKVGDKLDKKSVSFRVALIVKVENILAVYDKKNVSEFKKKQTINALIALKEVIEESLENNNSQAVTESLEILIIDDKRCSTCNTASLASELEETLGGDTTFVYQDFSDTGVSEYLENNGISALPAVIFSTKNFDGNTSFLPYLSELSNGGYALNIGATHDPFIERSERGYLVLESSVVTSLKNNSYIDGNKNAEILWIEYSDLECPFCAKLHNDGTIEKIQEKYGNSVAFSYKHFPLSFHQDAEGLAQATECIASGNSEVYYGTIDAIYAQSYSLSDLYKSFGEVSTSLESEIKLCVENETYLEKIQSHLNEGIEVFGVTGTPGNALINTKTGEYTTIGGAYPYATFESEIQKLLK